MYNCRLVKVFVVFCSFLFLGACGEARQVFGLEDSSSNNSGSVLDVGGVTVAPSVVGVCGPEQVNNPGVEVGLSGVVSYDRIPFASRIGEGLDYNNIQVLPVRGVRVELLDSNGIILSASKTDENGSYQFNRIPSNIDVQLRVLAEYSVTTTEPIWNVEIKDNTHIDLPTYAMVGRLGCSGLEDSQRDLHAPSGWDVSAGAYAGARAAAPFAILDTIYKVVQFQLAIDPRVRLPVLDIFWSENNNSSPGSFSAGDYAKGDIGSSQYLPDNRSLYILGDAAANADEYDEHVIAHEWGHYFEDAFSRYDSIGGSHSVSARLDKRLAFSEGLNNAFSAAVVGSSLYRDALALMGNEFNFDVEDNPVQGGWYVEGSIHSLLYDLYDDNNEGADSLSLGWQPIQAALVAPEFTEQASLSSIYSFAQVLKDQNPSLVAGIQSLLLSQNITGQGFFGEGETNDGGDGHNLPIYHQLTVDGGPVQLCTQNRAGEVNRLGVRGLVRFSSLGGPHKITATYDAVASDIQPKPLSPKLEFIIRNKNGFVDGRADPGQWVVSKSRSLPLGDYVIEVFEQSNLDEVLATGGIACVSMEVVSL